MLEIAMCLSLAAMGIYFFKSTDLPKEMRDRSLQHRQTEITRPSKKVQVSLPENIISKASLVEAKNADMLNQLEQIKRQEEIKLRSEKIDALSLKITLLEQELARNSIRHKEIQEEIENNRIVLNNLIKSSLV